MAPPLAAMFGLSGTCVSGTQEIAVVAAAVSSRGGGGGGGSDREISRSRSCSTAAASVFADW